MALAFPPSTPALEMLRHRVPTEVGPGHYLVTGRDGITEYSVRFGDCNCPAGRFGRGCWHKTCVLLYEAAVRDVVQLDEQLADLIGVVQRCEQGWPGKEA